MGKDKAPSLLAETVFVGEIVREAKFAELAFKSIGLNADSDEAWAAIQSILVAAANVSKILWPHSKYKMRGEHLRSLLSIEKDNILSKRTLRNHFEHYDERIEAWFKESKSSVYMDSRVDPFDEAIQGFPQFYHRSFNPRTLVVSFRDEKFELGEILNELSEVKKRCSNYVIVDQK